MVESEDPNHPPIEIEYVSTEDFPKILLATFCSKVDVKRVDAVELISKFDSKNEDKPVIGHIIDQIWL